MSESIVEVGSQDRIYADHINVNWYFKELLLTYKYGEKIRFRKALDTLKPYLSDKLALLFEEVYEESLWLNPITCKKGF